MSRGRQKVSFEGLLQENVLGSFKVIRGFADLGDLAEVSVPLYHDFKVRDGYQRQPTEPHIEAIKSFLKKGRYRFFPEIVLGLWSKGSDDPIVSYRKRRGSTRDSAYIVTVNLKKINAEPKGRIHRIDGNHRLEAAKRLLEEQRRGATFRDFTKAPFCFVVLDSDKPEDDDLAEAMLFNLINSKAKRLDSEHSLSVLMRDNGSEADRFSEDPQLYLTNWMRAKVKDWPHGFFSAMGDAPLSRLHSAAGVLLRPGGIKKATQQEMETDADHLFGPLYELAITLRSQYETFVHSYAFLPVAAEVYARHSTIEPAKGANTEAERLRRAERWLNDFARWFDRVGGSDLPMLADPCVLWNVFKRDYDRRAGQVFIAMSFREDRTLHSVRQAIGEAIAAFNQGHPNAKLAPTRVDEQKGLSYEIPARVFEEIGASRLLIADLTDEKPNVYCEVGYAMSKGIPFILTFHKTAAAPLAPWDRTTDSGSKVHFDLAAFRRIEYDNPMDLRDRLRGELDAWHDRPA
ncbi:MAG: hypothetical protein FJ222_02460 [Lentisphaerae bacterium]|nr:hypothetical protein [Lentisphaerota bacterium]